MVDAAGVVWVGHDLGASLLDTNAEQFYHFKHRPDDPNSLGHNTVWSLCEDREGILWICTDRGLNRFDPPRAISSCCRPIPTIPAGRAPIA